MSTIEISSRGEGMSWLRGVSFYVVLITVCHGSLRDSFGSTFFLVVLQSPVSVRTNTSLVIPVRPQT